MMMPLGLFDGWEVGFEAARGGTDGEPGLMFVEENRRSSRDPGEGG